MSPLETHDSVTFEFVPVYSHALVVEMGLLNAVPANDSVA